MAALCERYNLSPYVGRTDDVDITEALYCPNCGYGKPMKLNKSKTKVYCANPVALGWCGECCDYAYALTAARQLSGEFWSSGYKYPLTHRDVIERQLKACTTSLNDIPERREYWRQTLDQEEQGLIKRIETLRAELFALT